MKNKPFEQIKIQAEIASRIASLEVYVEQVNSSDVIDQVQNKLEKILNSVKHRQKLIARESETVYNSK